MKHAIPVKFIAIMLCAASLLAAVGSGLGIVILAEYGLYEKSVDELYTEQLEDQAYCFAQDLAQNYASTNLGGCPDEMLGSYHYFNSGYYGYTLKDAEGHVLASLAPAYDGADYQFNFSISGSYMEVLNTSANTDSGELFGESYGVYDAISEDSCLVYSFSYTWDGASESTAGGEPIGYLHHNEHGQAEFISFDPHVINLMEGEAIEPTHIVFFDENDEPIYEISGSSSVGQLSCNEAGLICFTAATATALNVPAAASYDVEATEPVTVSDTEFFSYFDSSLGTEVTVEYHWAVMPVYTVSMSILPGAIPNTYDYSLAGTLYHYRNFFPWLLTAGLLLFAVTLVYLCCAAGRKPGSDEVRPAGLNRVPLDLYLGAGILAGSVLGIACLEGGAALFRENAEVGIGFAGTMAYLIALLCVAFLFAFAAQVKCPRRYWLRNTICGRCLILLVRSTRWMRRKSRTFFPALFRGVRAGWNLLRRAVTGTFRFLGRTVKAVWNFAVSTLSTVFRWIGRGISRFFALLPLTWQWLLMGFALLFLMFLAFNASDGGWLLFFICAAFAIILYCAHCFGVLLESAKRMSKGDLETKVDDRLLIGCFRDFSGELNGLAGVATVAVQQQLKSERMKAELVTNVSHDIKTPLTSIINYVDLMKKPHTDEDHELYLEVLDRQSQQLKKLIDDLMEMSKASTGNIAVDLTRVNAAEAVNQALGEFADKFHTISLTPVFHHPEQTVDILADGRLVWRVLSNLLSNAYKYALPGTRLYLDLMVLDGKAVITIKNISKEQLNVDAAELMERFVRGDASRNTEGSGLGLNIAKSLVELQNGQMELMVDGDLFKVTLFFPLA